MKTKENDLVQDVEELLERTVLEEATAAVWQAFETALGKLDSESLSLLERHFNGASAEKLGQEQGLATTQVDEWLKKTKREVIEDLRRDSKVRQ